MNFDDYSYQGFSDVCWNNFTIDNEKKAKRRFFRIFFSLFLYMLIYNVAALAIQVIFMIVRGPDYLIALSSDPYFLILTNLVCIYVIAFPIFLLTTLGMKGTIRYKSKISFKEFFGYFLVCQAFVTVGSIASNVVNSILGIFRLSSTGSVDEIVTNSPVWLTILVVVIIGPVVEEFIFRKILMDKLGVYGDRLAIIVSSLCFGLIHGNVGQLFYAFIIGLLLGYVYSKTGRIIYPILLHVLVNFFGTVIPIITLKIEEILMSNESFAALMEAYENGGELTTAMIEACFDCLPLLFVMSALSFLTLGLSIAGVVVFAKNVKRVYVSDRCDVLIPKEKRAGIIFKNAGAILLIIAFLISFLLSAPLLGDIINAFTPDVTTPPPTGGGV